MLISAHPLVDKNATTAPVPVLAAVLKRPETFHLQEQPVPEMKPSEVLIRLEGCGICASSLPLWEGRPWFQYPLAAGAPGHEGWGEIVDIGIHLRQLRPDLRCGQKVTCLHERAFAGYAIVTARDVVPLPLPLHGLPFPGEAIGCAMNIFRRADIHNGQFVTIIGAGFLGLLLVQLASRAGAHVLVISRRKSGRLLAESFGAEATFDTENWWGNALKIMELTGGHGCARVVEATGMQFALDVATEIIAEYGRLVIAGYHQDGLRQVNMQKWNWRAIDVINAHERDSRLVMQGIAAGVGAAAEGLIHFRELLTHRFTLDQLGQAFRLLGERPDGFIKGWVQL